VAAVYDLQSTLAWLVTQSKMQEQSCRFCKVKLLSIRIFFSRFLELLFHVSKIAGVPVVISHNFLIQIHQLYNSSESELQSNKLVKSNEFNSTQL